MLRTIIAAACLAFTAFAGAQDYPNKPIRLVIPVPPGGGTDFFARTLAAKMSENMGQPIVIDNKPGAGMFIGVAALNAAPADGYTILISPDTTYTTNLSLYKQLPYDPAKDFAYVTLTARFTFLLVANPAVPANSVQELVGLLKSKPAGEFSFASPGRGSQHHLAMELFKQSTGTDLLHVPYKGAGPAVIDLIGGRIPVMFLDLATAAPQIRGGKMKALAVVHRERLAALPQVPTMAEAGLPGFEAGSWQGMVVPAATPRRIVERLNAEFIRAAADPAVRQKFIDAGIEPLSSTPEQFAAYVKNEQSRWADVIKKAGIAPE